MLRQVLRASAKSHFFNATKASSVRKPVAFLSTNAIDSFNNGSNSVYVEQMYEAWQKDPKRYAFLLIAIVVAYSW
jgi:hypothetical protein